MKRRAEDEHRLRVRHQVACGLALAFATCLGCMNPILRQQSPEARLDLAAHAGCDRSFPSTPIPTA